MAKAVARRSTEPAQVAKSAPAVVDEIVAAAPLAPSDASSVGKRKSIEGGGAKSASASTTVAPAASRETKSGSRKSQANGKVDAATIADALPTPTPLKGKVHAKGRAPSPGSGRIGIDGVGKKGAAPLGIAAERGTPAAGRRSPPVPEVPAPMADVDAPPRSLGLQRVARGQDAKPGSALAAERGPPRGSGSKSQPVEKPKAGKPAAVPVSATSRTLNMDGARASSIAKNTAVDQTTRSTRTKKVVSESKTPEPIAAEPPSLQAPAAALDRSTAATPAKTTSRGTKRAASVNEAVTLPAVEPAAANPSPRGQARSAKPLLKTSTADRRGVTKKVSASPAAEKRTKAAPASQAKMSAATKSPTGAVGGCAPVKLGFLSDFVGFHLRLAQDASYRAFARIKEKDLVKPGRFPALAIIHLNPGISQSALGRAIARDKSTVSPLIKDLQKNGFINRKPSACDRRSVTLVLTKKGERVLERLHVRAREHENDLDRLIGASKGKLVGLLDKITAALTA